MQRSQLPTYFLTVFLLAACNTAQSVEEPRYALIGTIGEIEFRHYYAVIQAKTALLDSGETAAGFRRLAELESLPTPNDPAVSLTHVPARTVAVIRFSGWVTPGKVRRYLQQLVDFLESQEIDTASAPMLNQYNPPWTPPFLRRNEIMLEMAEAVPLTQAAPKASPQTVRQASSGAVATGNRSDAPRYTF